jgi:hypothetical protein
MKSVRLVGTTDASGDLTVNGTMTISGVVYAIRWIDGDLVDGVDAVISTQGADASGTILTLTNANDDATYYTRVDSSGSTGSALTINDIMPLAVGKPRLVISDGGETKTGGCIIYYVEP